MQKAHQGVCVGCGERDKLNIDDKCAHCAEDAASESWGGR